MPDNVGRGGSRTRAHVGSTTARQRVPHMARAMRATAAGAVCRSLLALVSAGQLSPRPRDQWPLRRAVGTQPRRAAAAMHLSGARPGAWLLAIRARNEAWPAMRRALHEPAPPSALRHERTWDRAASRRVSTRDAGAHGACSSAACSRLVALVVAGQLSSRARSDSTRQSGRWAERTSRYHVQHAGSSPVTHLSDTHGFQRRRRAVRPWLTPLNIICAVESSSG